MGTWGTVLVAGLAGSVVAAVIVVLCIYRTFFQTLINYFV